MRGAETNQHHQKLVALCQHGSVQLRLLLSAMYYKNLRSVRIKVEVAMVGQGRG
jgi:hypothetical protein